ncbi:hypothetical protein QTN25_001563 [Entamoeba marina]
MIYLLLCLCTLTFAKKCTKKQKENGANKRLLLETLDELNTNVIANQKSAHPSNINCTKALAEETQRLGKEHAEKMKKIFEEKTKIESNHALENKVDQSAIDLLKSNRSLSIVQEALGMRKNTSRAYLEQLEFDKKIQIRNAIDAQKRKERKNCST